MRGQARAGKKVEQPRSESRLRVPEARRLLRAVGEPEEQQARQLHWSRFRRQHQQRACRELRKRH